MQFRNRKSSHHVDVVKHTGSRYRPCLFMVCTCFLFVVLGGWWTQAQALPMLTDFEFVSGNLTGDFTLLLANGEQGDILEPFRGWDITDQASGEVWTSTDFMLGTNSFSSSGEFVLLVGNPDFVGLSISITPAPQVYNYEVLSSLFEVISGGDGRYRAVSLPSTDLLMAVSLLALVGYQWPQQRLGQQQLGYPPFAKRHNKVLAQFSVRAFK